MWVCAYIDEALECLGHRRPPSILGSFGSRATRPWRSVHGLRRVPRGPHGRGPAARLRSSWWRVSCAAAGRWASWPATRTRRSPRSRLGGQQVSSRTSTTTASRWAARPRPTATCTRFATGRERRPGFGRARLLRRAELRQRDRVRRRHRRTRRPGRRHQRLLPAPVHRTCRAHRDLQEQRPQRPRPGGRTAPGPRPHDLAGVPVHARGRAAHAGDAGGRAELPSRSRGGHRGAPRSSRAPLPATSDMRSSPCPRRERAPARHARRVRAQGWTLQAANDVNQSLIVGYGLRGGGGGRSASTRPAASRWTWAPFPAPGNTFGRGVDVYGDVVGWAEVATDHNNAFVYSAGLGGMRRLGDMADPGQGWQLVQANAVNAHGMVVGWGYHNGGAPEASSSRFRFALRAERDRADLRGSFHAASVNGRRSECHRCGRARWGHRGRLRRAGRRPTRASGGDGPRHGARDGRPVLPSMLCWASGPGRRSSSCARRPLGRAARPPGWARAVAFLLLGLGGWRCGIGGWRPRSATTAFSRWVSHAGGARGRDRWRRAGAGGGPPARGRSRREPMASPGPAPAAVAAAAAVLGAAIFVPLSQTRWLLGPESTYPMFMAAAPALLLPLGIAMLPRRGCGFDGAGRSRWRWSFMAAPRRSPCHWPGPTPSPAGPFSRPPRRSRRWGGAGLDSARPLPRLACRVALVAVRSGSRQSASPCASRRGRLHATLPCPRGVRDRDAGAGRRLLDFDGDGYARRWAAATATTAIRWFTRARSDIPATASITTATARTPPIRCRRRAAGRRPRRRRRRTSTSCSSPLTRCAPITSAATATRGRRRRRSTRWPRRGRCSRTAGRTRPRRATRCPRSRPAAGRWRSPGTNPSGGRASAPTRTTAEVLHDAGYFTGAMFSFNYFVPADYPD